MVPDTVSTHFFLRKKFQNTEIPPEDLQLLTQSFGMELFFNTIRGAEYND